MKNVSVGQHSLLSQLEIEKTGDLDFEFHCIAGHALCFQHDRANQIIKGAKCARTGKLCRYFTLFFDH